MTRPRSARPCCRPSLRNQSWSVSRLLISSRPFGSNPVGAIRPSKETSLTAVCLARIALTPSRSAPLVTASSRARALEVRDHPALGGFALLFGEFLGVDDYAILTGEGEKIFHPLPADRDVAHGRKRDERLEERSAVDRLVAQRGNHFRQSELDEFDFARFDSA